MDRLVLVVMAPGTSADVLIWDGYGPSRTYGDFFDFEVGGHDGAFKGRIMSLCHSLEERMELSRPGNSCTMMCMDGIGHALSICLDSCGIGVWLGTFGVAAPVRVCFVAFHAILHSEAGLSPTLWARGPCPASALD